MAKAKLKPLIATFVQYLRDIDGLEEVFNFFEANEESVIFQYDFEADEYYIDVEGNDPFYLREGQYIVKLNGDYAIYDREVFEELFEEIEQE